MTKAYEELVAIHEKLEALLRKAEASEIKEPLNLLLAAAEAAGRAASGSWWGYHAHVYYEDLKAPPSGANFSPEWGLMERYSSDTVGDWVQYNPQAVEDMIVQNAGNPNIGDAQKLDQEACETIKRDRSEIISILSNLPSGVSDSVLEKIRSDTEEIESFTTDEFIRRIAPAGQTMSRDSLALTQGRRVPPHIKILAKTKVLQANLGSIKLLSEISQRSSDHLRRRLGRNLGKQTSGTKIFIGHGRSSDWKDLKDFIKDRLSLPYDEFNRVPVAGLPTATRLSEMLDNAALALLVMTAEDEQVDKKMHPRLNVVHEIGLFQGRLGFTKAIVVLEDGCEEFSNIHGVGQIRFPKGRISAVFEDIRLVLEREGLLPS